MNRLNSTIRDFAALATLVFLLGAPRGLIAQEITLKVGDAAPGLTGGKWLKGEPVKAFEPGKIYVVDFWGTWCQPCRQSIPLLTALQEKYAGDGVIVIGQDAWEQDPGTIEPFVVEMGDKMKYHVAADSDLGEDGSMGKNWLTASQHTLLPCAFLIDKTGKIVWIGNTIKVEPVLQKLIAGTLDPQKEVANQVIEERMDQLVKQTERGGNIDAALAAIDDYEKLHPDTDGKLALTRYALLLQKKDEPGAQKTGEALAERFKSQPVALNGLAWAIVQYENPGKDLIDFGLKTAARADELDKDNYQFLDTLAQLTFIKGDVDKAIDLEDRAINLAPMRMQLQMQNTMDDFLAAKKK